METVWCYSVHTVTRSALQTKLLLVWESQIIIIMLNSCLNFNKAQHLSLPYNNPLGKDWPNLVTIKVMFKMKTDIRIRLTFSLYISSADLHEYNVYHKMICFQMSCHIYWPFHIYLNETRAEPIEGLLQTQEMSFVACDSEMECDFTEIKSSWFSIMATREWGLILMIKAYSICFLLRTEEHLMSCCIIGLLYWVEDTEKPDALKQNLIDIRSIWSTVCGLVDRPTGINVKWKTKGPQVTWKFSKTRKYYYFERSSI